MAKFGLLLFIPVGLRPWGVKRRASGVATSIYTPHAFTFVIVWSLRYLRLFHDKNEGGKGFSFNLYPELKGQYFELSRIPKKNNGSSRQCFETCLVFQDLVALLYFLGFSFNAASTWQLWATTVHKFRHKFQFLTCLAFIFCLRDFLFLHITMCGSYSYHLLQLGYPHRLCNHWRLELCWYSMACPRNMRQWV